MLANDEVKGQKNFDGNTSVDKIDEGGILKAIDGNDNDLFDVMVVKRWR